MSKIGSIPGSWETPCVEDVCEIISGYGFPKKLQGKSVGDIPFFKVGDISEAWQKNKVGLDIANHYLNWQEMKSLKAQPLPPNTVVFAKIGAAIGLNRRAILKQPSLVDNNVMGVWAESRFLNTFFLFHFFCTLRFGENSRASIVPSIRKSDVGNVQLPLPPLNEQHRIVSKIEELFSKLDAGVAALERVKANLKRYRASVLKAAVEGKLTEKWRAENPDREPASRLLERILIERRHKWEEEQLANYQAKGQKPPKDWRFKYKEPAKPDTADLPDLPEGWCWATVDQISCFVTSGSRGWAKYYSESGPLFIRAQDINKDWLDLTNIAHVNVPESSEKFRTRTQQGDLLITITGANVTKSALVRDEIGEAYVSQHVALVHPVTSILFDYVFHWVICPSKGRNELEKLAYGAGKPGLNLDNVRTLCVALPPNEEAIEIVNSLTSSLETIEKTEIEIRRNALRAARLRQAILKHAFEGKLVPQDPSDEPAAKLLERIRAERAKAEDAPQTVTRKPRRQTARAKTSRNTAAGRNPVE